MPDQPRIENSPPAIRAELLARHAAARRRRNAAPLGSPEFQAACEEISQIEVEIARIERAAQPPLG
jgi:hypothetical protein